MAAPKGNNGYVDRRRMTPHERFLSYCRFEPETGCVIWIGAQTAGRGHHVPYGSFWFEGSSWYAHRWSAKFIHGLEIDDVQVDHCCPNIILPNTLCVEHVQPKTLLENRELQALRAFEARKRGIHLQVGLLKYEDVYGPQPDPGDDIPIQLFPAPAWLGTFNARHHRATSTPGPVYADCPF